MNHSIRSIISMAIAGLTITVMPHTAAMAEASFPTKPLTLILGFPPGGGADHVGRVYANALSKVLGQPVVVENRPGAGSTIGAGIAARAAPDGYTMFLGNSSVMGSDNVLYKVDYTPDSFIPVAQLTSSPMVLIANASKGIKSVKDLVERAKKDPGGLNVASSGNGVITHLAAVEFMSRAGVDLMHIPFKGGAPATQSVAAGDTDISFATAPSAKAIIETGKVIGLGVTSSNKSKLLEYAPIAETVPGYDISNWWGIFVPKNTPDAIVQKLFDATKTVLAQEQVRTSLEAGYEEVTPSASVAEFQKYARAEGEKGLRLAKTSTKTVN
ncbi:MAG: tripartite tricarboxylate transporter substrate binding protein [Alcaligenaceae bacterium]|nr:tripartite tricarboxylate transporter substrate binding protein [Alcaligenaceae bacterium]